MIVRNNFSLLDDLYSMIICRSQVHVFEMLCQVTKHFGSDGLDDLELDTV